MFNARLHADIIRQSHSQGSAMPFFPIPQPAGLSRYTVPLLLVGTAPPVIGFFFGTGLGNHVFANE